MNPPGFYKIMNLLTDLKQDWQTFKDNFDPRADEVVAVIFAAFAFGIWVTLSVTL